MRDIFLAVFIPAVLQWPGFVNEEDEMKVLSPEIVPGPKIMLILPLVEFDQHAQVIQAGDVSSTYLRAISAFCAWTVLVSIAPLVLLLLKRHTIRELANRFAEICKRQAKIPVLIPTPTCLVLAGAHDGQLQQTTGTQQATQTETELRKETEQTTGPKLRERTEDRVELDVALSYLKFVIADCPCEMVGLDYSSESDEQGGYSDCDVCEKDNKKTTKTDPTFDLGHIPNGSLGGVNLSNGNRFIAGAQPRNAIWVKHQSCGSTTSQEGGNHPCFIGGRVYVAEARRESPPQVSSTYHADCIDQYAISQSRDDKDIYNVFDSNVLLSEVEAHDIYNEIFW